MSNSAATYQTLQTLARKQGRATNEVQTLYALEKFLHRLTQTTYRDDFVLKGGVLLAAYDLRRPTRDIDMQAVDIRLDESLLRDVVAAVVKIEADDGLIFDSSQSRITAIRDEDEYSGLRIRLTATLHTAKLFLHIDVSTGDPIWPSPQTVLMPGMLGEDFEIVGYPAVAVVAEKSVTIVQRGSTSTRWRDFVDLRNFAKRFTFRASDLVSAVDSVAMHRA